MTGMDGVDNSQKFVDILGLRTIFPLFMKTPKTARAGPSSDELEGRTVWCVCVKSVINMMAMCLVLLEGSWDSLLVEHQTWDWKVASSNPGRSDGGIFLFKVNCVVTLIRCLFHPCITAVAHKRPLSFCQKCRWQVTPNTHTPLTQWSQGGLTMPLCRHSVGTYQGNKLTWNSSGNTWPQSSQLAELLWTDPGLKSGINVHNLISHLKINLNMQVGNQLSKILPKSSHAKKKSRYHHYLCWIKIAEWMKQFDLWTCCYRF